MSKPYMHSKMHATVEFVSLTDEANRQIDFWKFLKQKLDVIYNDDPKVNAEFLTECYDKVYDHIMYENKKQIELRNLGKQQFYPGSTQDVSRELYYFLIGYMSDKSDLYESHFKTIDKANLLEYYAMQWRHYKKISTRVQFVFKYLDRYFVATEREDPSFCEILEIYEFAIFQWKKKIFHRYQGDLLVEILRFLRAEREGKRIDEKIIGTVTKSLMEVGGVKEDFLSFYKPFETEFLKETESFYKEKSRKLMIELNTLKSISFKDYMNIIHQTFAHETDRVETYFDKSSIPKVMKICEECLIKDHVDVFKRAFEQFLEINYFEEIDQFYDLIKRFPDDLDTFTKVFTEHVQKEGEEAIVSLDNVQSVDMKTYVEKLISISEKYENIIKNRMENNEVFLSALEDSMKVIVNENAVTHASTFGDINGELLAKYIDKLLTKNSVYNYNNDELKAKLYHAWRIFKVLNDKDGFQKFYENITARRLIFHLTVSEEHEKFMVDKMRDYFGEQDSKSLREILENLKISKDIGKHFMEIMALKKETGVLKSFSVSVLAERTWPFPSASLYAVSRQIIDKLPPILEFSTEQFKKYYARRYEGVKQPKERKLESLGRKIHFLHNLGKGELYAQFLNKTYILEVGAFQMVVLMQFNDNNKFTFGDLKKRAGISTAPEKFFKETFFKLVEAKILTCDGDFSKLNDKTKIKLNIDFKSAQTHINLDHMVDAEVEINRKEVMKHIDDDREILAQCAIARVMKRRKRLHKTDLTKEVIDECSKRFKAEPLMITRSLGISVKKDIIEVDVKDTAFYIYKDY